MSEDERAVVVATATSAAFRDLSPAQIVPRLADAGVYIASEASFYRILRAEKMMSHRNAAKPAERKRPEPHEAQGPNEVWSWDITFLKSPVRGMFYYLYMVVDVWSRKIVGWAVRERESAELAREPILLACARESVDPESLILHSNNGAAMKGATLLATLHWLGIVPSFSRPRVYNDNAYSTCNPNVGLRVENGIRSYAVGRRNWLFNNTPLGAYASAGMYSLVETARINNLDPSQFLRRLFSELPHADTEEKLTALLPWNMQGLPPYQPPTRDN